MIFYNRLKRLKMYEFVRAVIFVKNPINEINFSENWENDFGWFHEPNPQEIVQRLKMLHIQNLL